MTDNFLLAFSVGKNVALSVLVMFLLMSIGFVMAKKKILTPAGIKQMSELVLRVVVPCVIINAYQRQFNAALVKSLLLGVIFAVIFHIIQIVASPLVFRKREDKKDRVYIFSSIYSNCGFMAFPLVEALYGTEGVFFSVSYLTVFNILHWTHGVYTFTKDIKQLSLKKAFLTPGVLGTLIGLLLFVSGITLPSPVTRTLGFVSALNTPLPMIILGTYLVSIDLKKIIKDGYLWLVSLMRLLIYPVIGILIAKLMGLDGTLAMSLILSASCPIATVTTLFAVRYDVQSEYASEGVSFSTILSIITIPLVMVIATLVL